MRALFGCGTPREAADIASGLLWIIQSDKAWAVLLFAPDIGGEPAFLIIGVTTDRR
jgi:hypothetical protein